MGNGDRRTPGGPDTSMAPQGDREHVYKAARRPSGDPRRPLPAVRRHKDGSPMEPLPAVVQRWKRFHAAPTPIEKEARVGETVPETKPRDMPTLQYLSADAQAKGDSQFKPNLAYRPCIKPSPPVLKHHYYSEGNIVEAQKVKPVAQRSGPSLASTYSLGNPSADKLDIPICSHHNFAEDSLRNSLSFQSMSPKEPFNATRRRVTASASAVALRMDGL